MRLVRPFIRVLPRDNPVFTRPLTRLEAIDPDGRLRVTTVHEMLRNAVAITGDAHIGLEAAREISHGDYGELDYVASSAPTLGHAIQVVRRYLRLLADSIDLSLQIEGERALLQVESRIVLPHPSVDFLLAAIHYGRMHVRPCIAKLAFEVWFSYSRPRCTEEYERTFAPGTLRFDAPFNGFTFDRSYLDAPLAREDAKLHELMRKHADSLLAELRTAECLTARVRDIIRRELPTGDASIVNVARRLHMSTRTLNRKLEREGVNFKRLLDDTRRRLALSYVSGHQLELSEIASRLGFSQPAAFHRAFKRWTGQTPSEYRRRARQRGDRS